MVDPTGFIVLGVGGFTIGILIGMALKALARLAMYVVGLYLASLVALGSLGLITVNWEGIASFLGNVVNYITSLTDAGAFTSMGAFGTATLLGTIYGAIRAQISKNKSYKFFKKMN